MIGNNKKNNQQLKNLTGVIDLLSIRTSSLILLSVISLALITNLQLKEKNDVLPARGRAGFPGRFVRLFLPRQRRGRENRINVLKISQEQAEVDEIYPLKISQPIYKLTITGSGFLAKENSFLRIVLVDKNKNEYLVYEAYPLTVDSSSFSFTTACEETCLLDKITPDYLKIYGHQASYQINKIGYTDDLQKLSGGKKLDIALERQRIKKDKDDLKIAQLNKQIKVKSQKWLAAETSVSKLTYAQKKKLFSNPDGKPVEKLPNLQGFEFYKGGIFEIKSDNPLPTPVSPSTLPASWDWRNVHGENWMTLVKRQGECGSCWAFAAVGAVETNLNLYFNQHANIDLSEQDLVSCSGAGSCGGGFIGPAVDYIKDQGVVDESCFTYQTADVPCQKCSDSDRRKFKIGLSLYPNDQNENQLKQILIEKGAVASGFFPWHHAMTLIGYGRSDWELIQQCNQENPCIQGIGCSPENCQKEGDELTTCSFGFGYNGPDFEETERYVFLCKRREDGRLGWKFINRAESCSSSQTCIDNRCQDKWKFKESEISTVCAIDIYWAECYWKRSPRQGRNYWLFKNSWGADWGEEGYVKFAVDAELLNSITVPAGPFTLPLDRSYWPSGFDGQIKCVDKDNDGYCNWGISQDKPLTCPASCKPQKDCDDSNPNLGPFDGNLNCRQINLSPTPTTTVAVPTPIVTKAYCSSLNPCKPGYYCKCLAQPKEGSGGGCFCEKM